MEQFKIYMVRYRDLSDHLKLVVRFMLQLKLALQKEQPFRFSSFISKE